MQASAKEIRLTTKIKKQLEAIKNVRQLESNTRLGFEREANSEQRTATVNGHDERWHRIGAAGIPAKVHGELSARHMKIS